MSSRTGRIRPGCATALTQRHSSWRRTDLEKKATFGAGCFWGVEAAFRQVDGVTKTEVGYEGGHLENPSYQDVCSHTTGHAEVVEVTYDPERVPFETLLEVFWNKHNPTQKNRQGWDIGDQYRSVVFFHDEEQRAAAERSKADLDASGRYRKPVVTLIEPAQTFYRAEEYHQRYLEKQGRSSCTTQLAEVSYRRGTPGVIPGRPLYLRALAAALAAGCLLLGGGAALLRVAAGARAGAGLLAAAARSAGRVRDLRGPLLGHALFLQLLVLLLVLDVRALAGHRRASSQFCEISSTISPTFFSFACSATSAWARTPTTRPSSSTTGSRRTWWVAISRSASSRSC